MHIRLIDAALDNVDIIVDESNPTAVENHKLIPKKLLAGYLDEWLDFVARVNAQKSNRPDDAALDREVAEKLMRFGSTLHALLFQPAFQCKPLRELVFSVDATWARLPFELLPMGKGQYNFAGLQVPVLRQLRSIPHTLTASNSRKSGQKFLVLANPEGAADIAATTDSERKSLERIIDAKHLHVLGRLASVARTVDELTHCEYLHYSGHVRDQSLHFDGDSLRAQDIASMDLQNLKLALKT